MATLALSELLRCPFVRAVADGDELEARRLAALPPDPVEPGPVLDWLITEVRRQLDLGSAAMTTPTEPDEPTEPEPEPEPEEPAS